MKQIKEGNEFFWFEACGVLKDSNDSQEVFLTPPFASQARSSGTF